LAYKLALARVSYKMKIVRSKNNGVSYLVRIFQ
jgi:hypothetical protein